MYRCLGGPKPRSWAYNHPNSGECRSKEKSSKGRGPPPRSKRPRLTGSKPIGIDSRERMQNASLSQEISRLYKDLSDHILARDGAGASRIYQELLRAGQSLEMLAARVPAIQQAAEEQGSKIPDGPPPQGSAEPGLARGSIIERAVQRSDWTTAHNTPLGLERTRNGQSQPDPARVLRPRFGDARPTRLPLIFRLRLGTVLAVAAAGSGIFLLTHSAKEKVTAESAPGAEASAKASQNTSSIGDRTITTPVAQSATPAGVAPTAAPTVPDSELEAEPALGIPPSVPPPGGPMPTRTPSNKPEVAMSAAPTLEATSTVAALASRKPPTKPALSGAEIAALLARGDWLFATGDVGSARLLYERAAEAGEAGAAVRLGETFDPIFLDKAHLREVRGFRYGHVLVSSCARPRRHRDHQPAEKPRSKIAMRPNAWYPTSRPALDPKGLLAGERDRAPARLPGRLRCSPNAAPSVLAVVSSSAVVRHRAPETGPSGWVPKWVGSDAAFASCWIIW